MGGENHDYRFGNKNNWRRWAWNRIEERLMVPAREATVLYLPSAKDLDREIAIDRGFYRHNLIGVERDGDTANALRRSKVLCIHGDFIEAVNSFPPDRTVDVVFADFTCDISNSMCMSISKWMDFPNLRKCVFAFNIQRGRDSSLNWLRKYAESAPSNWAYARKHRGMQLWTMLVEMGTQKLTGPGTAHEKSGWIAKGMMVELNEYKSKHKNGPGNTIFDSIVFRNPLWRLRDLSYESPSREIMRSYFKGSMRNQIAAILAHRTMRINSA